MEPNPNGNKIIYQAGFLSIVGNTVLFALKLWAGIITGSVALTADAWHTLTDSISSGIVIISAWMGSRPADDSHPFGHGRADLISSVIIGVLLAVIGVEFIIQAVEQIRSGEFVVFGKVAIIVTVVSIVTKELMAQFSFWASRRTGNAALKADGWHHRTDALSSVVVLVGILCSKLFSWIDGALGILVAILIFYASYEILRDSIHRLIGEQPEEDLLNKIDEIIEKFGFNMEPHHYHLHRYGDHVELTFHISMPGHLTLNDAHDQANLVESELREKLNIEATIHMEPYRKEHENN